MSTRRGTATTDRRVMWQGTVNAGQLGWAWRDVSVARGKPTDAPPTRPIRLDLTADEVTVVAFCPDLLLHTTMKASNVTSEAVVQIAIADAYRSLTDMIKGMANDGGDAELELGAGTPGDVQEMWQPDELTVRWNGQTVSQPIAQMGEVNWRAIAGLAAMLDEGKRKRVGKVGLTPSVHRRLGALGKACDLTYNGDGIPWTVATADGLGGSILANVMDVRAPDRTEVGKAVESEVVKFLDLLRRPVKDVESDPDGFDDVPLDPTLDVDGEPMADWSDE